MFEEKEYYGEDFSDALILEDCLERMVFIRCRFQDADFAQIRMDHCRFEDCVFDGARMNGAEIVGCAFLNCDFRFADFGGAELIDCKMTGSDFTDTRFVMTSFGPGDWSYTVLERVEFSGYRFEDILFRGADLTSSEMHGIDFLTFDFSKARIDLDLAVTIAESLGARVQP